MTNKAIIMMQTALLIDKGVISEDSSINTWVGWKMRGFRVKRGEVHIAEFPIWVRTPQKKQAEAEARKEDEENTEEKPKKNRDFVFQTAYWFSDKQVERL